MVDTARYAEKEEQKVATVRRWAPLAWVGVAANVASLGYALYRLAVNVTTIGVLSEAFIAAAFALVFALLGVAMLLGWRRWFTKTRTGDGLSIMLLVTTAFAVAAFSGILIPEFHELRNL